MGLTADDLKQKFAFMMNSALSDAVPEFVSWLDTKLTEYKTHGWMILDILTEALDGVQQETESTGECAGSEKGQTHDVTPETSQQLVLQHSDGATQVILEHTTQDADEETMDDQESEIMQVITADGVQYFVVDKRDNAVKEGETIMLTTSEGDDGEHTEETSVLVVDQSREGDSNELVKVMHPSGEVTESRILNMLRQRSTEGGRTVVEHISNGNDNDVSETTVAFIEVEGSYSEPVQCEQHEADGQEVDGQEVDDCDVQEIVASSIDQSAVNEIEAHEVDQHVVQGIEEFVQTITVKNEVNSEEIEMISTEHIYESSEAMQALHALLALEQPQGGGAQRVIIAEGTVPPAIVTDTDPQRYAHGRRLVTQIPEDDQLTSSKDWQVLRCNTCGESFQGQRSLLRHKRLSHWRKRQRSSHICHICQRVFPWKKSLTNHMPIHSTDKPYPCEICNKTFKRIDLLRSHLKVHTSARMYQCSICNKTYKHLSSLKDHNRTHTDVDRKPFSCDLCPRKFARQTELWYHKRAHAGIKNHQCSLCLKKFVKPLHLQKHILQVHHSDPLFKQQTPADKKHQCQLCGKKYHYANQLRQHNLWHSGERPHKCEHCGKGFISVAFLNKHLLTHREEKAFKCSLCTAEFCTKVAITRHMALHSDGKTPHVSKRGRRRANVKAEQDEDDMVKDPMEMTNTLDSLTIPEQETANDDSARFEHQCPVCSKTFRKKEYLARHTPIHGGNDLQFICEECGKMFGRKDNLLAHVRQVHYREKKYQCSICAKTFATNAYLKEHELCHTNPKSFLCSYCGKSYSLSGTLKKHLLIHTTKKASICSVCGQAFLDPADLHQHKLTHDEFAINSYSVLQ